MTRRAPRGASRRSASTSPAEPLGRRAILGIVACSLLFLMLGLVLTRNRDLDALFIAGLVLTVWGLGGLISAVRFYLVGRS